MGILEKISDIEKEIAKTQKNKGRFGTGVFLFWLMFPGGVCFSLQPPSTIWDC